MIYQRIRDLREDADMKQRDVAEYLHCSQQVYSNYELGQRDIPTAVLIALAAPHQCRLSARPDLRPHLLRGHEITA